MRQKKSAHIRKTNKYPKFQFLHLKFCPWETLNISMCADRSTNTKTYIYIKMSLLHKKNSPQKIPRVPCHKSLVTCYLVPVTCHLSPTPTAIVTDPPPANSRNIHQDRTQKPKTVLKKYKNGQNLKQRGVLVLQFERYNVQQEVSSSLDSGRRRRAQARNQQHIN